MNIYNPRNQNQKNDQSPYYYVNNGYSQGIQTTQASPSNGRISNALSQTLALQNKRNQSKEGQQSPLNQTSSFRAGQQKKNYMFANKFKPTLKQPSNVQRISQNQKRRIQNTTTGNPNLQNPMNTTFNNSKNVNRTRTLKQDEENQGNSSNINDSQRIIGSQNNISGSQNNNQSHNFNLLRKKGHNTNHISNKNQQYFQETQNYNPNHHILDSLPNSKTNLDTSNDRYQDKISSTPKHKDNYINFKQNQVQPMSSKNTIKKQQQEMNEKQAQQYYFVQGQINTGRTNKNNQQENNYKQSQSYRQNSENGHHQQQALQITSRNAGNTIHITPNNKNYTPSFNGKLPIKNIQAGTPSIGNQLKGNQIHPNTTREGSKDKSKRKTFYIEDKNTEENSMKNAFKKFDVLIKNRNSRGQTSHENNPNSNNVSGNQNQNLNTQQQQQILQQQKMHSLRQQQLLAQQQQLQKIQQQQQLQQQNNDNNNDNDGQSKNKPINYELNNFFYQGNNNNNANNQSKVKDKSQNSNGDQTTRAVSTQNQNFKSSQNESLTAEESVQKETDIDNYQFGRVLGLGSYAIVRQAMHKPSGQKVAVKTYDKKKLQDPMKLKNVQREIKILSRLRHPNIIRLYQIIETDNQVHLVMELSSSMPLNDFMKTRKQKRVSEEDAKIIIRQLADALKYCHRKCVVHRDIKLENVLVDQNRVVKLVDFGFAVVVPPGHSLNIFCGTPSYMAPEIVNKKDYAFPVDSWAMAILCFKLVSGHFPFKGQSDKELYRKINSCRPDFPQFFSYEIRRFIQKIVRFLPGDRLPLEDVIKDDWIVGNTCQDQELDYQPSLNDKKAMFDKMF